MWETVASIIQQYKVAVQAVLDDDEPDDWSPWFILPTNGYGEVNNYGPFSLNKLKELRVDPIERQKIGTRVPDKAIDHTDSIAKALTDQHVIFERKGNIIVIEAID